VFRVLLLALIASTLAACASGPVKRVFPPEARVQEIRLNADRADVLVRVQSFSTVPSEVQSYSLTLEFAGALAARLEGTTATTVLPQAAETLAINTTLDAAALERAKAALANGAALRYRLHGTITVEPNGRAYPIDYSSALSRAPGLDGVLR
jgi:LEA14-like dessication related protein